MCYYKKDALYVRCQSGWTADTIDNMAAITNVLELTGGSVKKLDQGHMKRFLRLQSLFLTNNDIRDIQTLSFDGLSELLWLNISQDNFTTLTNDAFKGLDMLQGIGRNHN
ncbi:leucine-rich glioma-inactivated protein 1-like [Acanthaster planci]|uniref:Leucine-rich glioma-inactivated protein 1-like n=1 Tax=Acanthaster planci TaxID=133434 RepID=A0A8B8A0W2_ACAPL|nr:leucine-rich glioma-inactivated protein 1-like [Acanthaster planci]